MINAVTVAPSAREKRRLGSLISGSLKFDDDLDREGRRIHEDGSNCEKLFFMRFRKIAKKTTISFTLLRLSVRPHGTTRLPLDRFSCKLIYECFSKKLSRKFKFH